MVLQQSDAPAINRELKPKVQQGDNNEKLTTPNKAKPVPLVKPNQSAVELKPPCIDRTLKPTTPIKVGHFTVKCILLHRQME